MAKGSVAKEKITNTIMQVFPDAFMYGNKEIRVPFDENGVPVEIKVTLTCAKENVKAAGTAGEASAFKTEDIPKQASAPTQEEIDNINTLMNRLGL